MPPVIHYVTFSCENYTSLFVPCNSLEDYQNAQYWSYFSRIYCIEELGVKELEANSDFTLYPNPASSEVTVKPECFGGNADVVVYDISGKQVVKEKLSGQETLKLDISHLPSGMYMVKIVGEGASSSRKLVVQ